MIKYSILITFLFFGITVKTEQNEKIFEILDLTETIEKHFEIEFTKYAQTGIVSKELKSIYDLLRLPDDFKYKEMYELPEATSVSHNKFLNCDFSLKRKLISDRYLFDMPSNNQHFYQLSSQRQYDNGTNFKFSI